MKEEFTNYTLG